MEQFDIYKGIVLTPKPVTIKDIFYIIDKFGSIRPSIKIFPSLEIPTFNNRIINQSLIHLDPFIEPGYDKISKGSKIRICRTPIFPQENDNVQTSKLILELVDDTENDNDVALFPKSCPSCGHLLRICNGQYICNNTACPTQLMERCTHFIKSINMYLHGIYYQIFCILISRGIIKNPIDIFTVDENTIYTAIDNIHEKHVKVFKLLVNDVIGKVSMTELLHGLCVIPDVNDDIYTIRRFVSYQNDKAVQLNKIFDISALIQLVHDTVKHMALYVPEENDKIMLTIFDQLQKLSSENMEKVEDAFGHIGLYRISGIMDYVLNKYNLNILETLHSIGLIGFNK